MSNSGNIKTSGLMLIAYLERINPEKNERRFYVIYFVHTLLGPAVVRVHGRKGAWTRMLPPVFFPGLEAARPYIEHLVRRRLRHGYSLVKGPKGGQKGTTLGPKDSKKHQKGAIG